MEKLLVVSGAGNYPELVIKGARKAGVRRVDVLAIKGSASFAVRRLADSVRSVALRDFSESVRWAGAQGYEGVILAGQLSPISLFRGGFDDEIKAILEAMPVKNAHSLFRKVIELFENAGARVLPASLFMEDHIPGAGPLTDRAFTEGERSDIAHAIDVARDMGTHDVGQTVVVKAGMVLAVEAFEGTNAAIRRAGKLAKGAVLCKAAREGHDWRFDIPVVGLKTLKTMKKAGVTALAFQAGRLLLLDREEVIAFANRHGIAIVGVDSGLPPAPTRP